MKTSGFLSANIKLTEARAKVIEDLAREFPGKSFNHIINLLLEDAIGRVEREGCEHIVGNDNEKRTSNPKRLAKTRG